MYTAELDHSVSWLLQLLEHAGPREWPWNREAVDSYRLFGDASEPGAACDPRICAGVLCCPRAHRVRVFAVRVPAGFLRKLVARQKQICVLELLWAVLAAILWGSLLRGAHVMLFEDNESARGGLRKGMSRHVDINALLASFWGLAALGKVGYWTDRVASADNPADCLTKPGL